MEIELFSEAESLLKIFSTISKDNPFLGGVIGIWVLGVLSYFARNIPLRIKSFLYKQFTVTATIRNSDASFYHLIKWLEARGYGDKARTLVVSNGRWGYEDEAVISVGLGVHFFRIGFCLYRLGLEEKETLGNNVKESITITTLGRSQKAIRKLLKCIEPSDLQLHKTTKIFNWTLEGWRLFAEQPKRPFDSVILTDYNHNKLIKKLDRFVAQRGFHLKHGIPYRDGIELWGPPGTGKTVLSLGLCSYMNRNLYKINLSEMTDTTIEVAFASVKEGIILIEDADTHGVLDRRDLRTQFAPVLISSEAPKEEDMKEADSNKYQEEITKPVNETKKTNSRSSFLTLKGVLNAIDGVATSDGRILIMTTNDPDIIDPAIRRKGRISLSLRMDFLTHETYIKMFKRFYPSFSLPDDVEFQTGGSAADFQDAVLENMDNPLEVLKQFQVSAIKEVV